MKNSIRIATIVSGAIAVACASSAFAVAPQSKLDYTAAVDRATLAYKDARTKCEPLAGHAKDMCVVEAKAVEKRAKALAEAHLKGTLKAATASRIADADAGLMVAKVGCDAVTGQDRTVCVKQAQATNVKLVAEAKANKTAIDAVVDAREDTRAAQFKVEVAKCDALAGAEKDACMSSAKAAYGK